MSPIFFYAYMPKFQVATLTQCQVLLDVQLLGFEHENNLETGMTDDGGIKYCCCEGGPCGGTTTAAPLRNCPPTCDVFFNVTVSECQYSSACSITTMNEPIINSPSVSSHGYSLRFILDNISPQVSHCSTYVHVCVHHISGKCLFVYMYMNV